ncbi:MAG TPA: DUF1592 domain-containing protein [Bryobacteraceae bacterium]|nr:DUF1592 domain-containing protein [Bryobacteraceae bacterium]
MRLAPGLIALFAIPSAGAATSAVEQQFSHTVRPFIDKYCVGCHSGASAAAQFDLKAYTTVESVVRDHPRWSLVSDKLTAKQMPPSPMPQPPDEARQQVIEWIKAMRMSEARKNAGDPGVVLARRLSNAEYDYTIRDLTGVDIRPAREFPVDPANQAGFDNTGESLTMSPSLLNKYLQAAREVGDHMVLTPDGIDFAPHPMLVETDRDKYAIKRIVDFYQRQPTDFADYFQAAWRYKHRAALGKPALTLSGVAAENKVSPKYLSMVWQILEEPADAAKKEVGPIAKLQSMWRALPPPSDPDGVLRAKCVEMRDFVVRIRNHTAMQFAAPVVRGIPAGSQPLLNWKYREFNSHRRDFDRADLRNDTDPEQTVLPTIPRFPGLHQEAAPRWAAVTAKARAGDPDLIVPAAERPRYEASFARLANVFPDAFYVKERGRYFPDDSEDKGRLLSAGYHNVMGYWRDDTPLQELILDEKGKKELDRLWDEFDFIAAHTERTWDQYYFNQSGEVDGKGAESGRPRPLDHKVTDEAVIFGLRDAYIAKAEAAKNPVAVQAFKDHFQWVNDILRRMERLHAEAEPHHLDALLKFAGRAYRRPLTKAEHDDILAYYRQLRDKDGLSHEDAIRESIVSVLMSPYFCYRIDLLDTGDNAHQSGTIRLASATSGGAAVHPLSGYALASRLSYFLWSSMPDQELLAHAASGDLHRPDVLLAQTRRMLKDPKSRGMATEFGGNWLDFRHFETQNSVDRDRFPSFTNDLREAMFEEPIALIEDMIQHNRSVLDMIYGNYTFVNPSLAKHYGMPEVSGGEDHWVRVDNANEYGRGGLLPMAVFLTENSPGLRTSPVKRGAWLVKKVLGEVIPPPPAVVPELPNDEAKSDLPLRDMLAKHRENKVCASCHARFDVFGLAFEGYGPIGESRTKDLAGRPIDAKAMLPGGVESEGFAGVEAYIREHRQADYLDNISRKLLAYGLGRSLALSDDLVVQRMVARMPANGYRFDSLVETIVTSPQFLNRRSPESHEKPDLPLRKGD